MIIVYLSTDGTVFEARAEHEAEPGDTISGEARDRNGNFVFDSWVVAEVMDAREELDQ